MRRTIDRADLHAMVWNEAVSKVAARLGISDVALRKQCIKHAIPLPDARYRGLVNAGRPAARVPLPSTPPGVSDQVIIIGSQVGEPPLAIREAAATARSRGVPTEVSDRHHPIVARTIAAARRRPVDLHGALAKLGPDHLHVRLHPDQLERAGSFLNRLVRSALAAGHAFAPGREGLDAIVDGEHVPFAISQTIRRTVHVATAEERERQRRWDRRHGHDWDACDHRLSIPAYDFTATGEMALEIRAWTSGDCGTRRFADTRTRKLEDRLADILAALAAHAAGLKLRRAEQQERAHAAEAERLRQAEVVRLARLEKDRVAYVEGKIAELARRDGYRALVTHLAMTLDREEPRSERLLSWCEAALAELEAGLTAASITSQLDCVEAFD